GARHDDELFALWADDGLNWHFCLLTFDRSSLRAAQGDGDHGRGIFAEQHPMGANPHTIDALTNEQLHVTTAGDCVGVESLPYGMARDGGKSIEFLGGLSGQDDRYHGDNIAASSDNLKQNIASGEILFR